jgi:N-acetylglutamate synthase-like GNAT family acetyltransferase
MLAGLEFPKTHAPEKLISVRTQMANGHHTCTDASKSRLTIRIARTDDTPGILELAAAVFQRVHHLSWIKFASAGDIESLMKNGKFLLAENERQIVGCAYIEPRIEACRLDLLAVAPSQQRAGIGSQLLEAAERVGGSMQCLFMHLRIMNLHWETIKFCRRRGYVEFGIESLSQNQPISLHCHVVRMFKPLVPDSFAF